MSTEEMKQGELWKNKWNRREYKIVKFSGRNIVLERNFNSGGSFTIEISEFLKNYEPLRKK